MVTVYLSACVKQENNLVCMRVSLVSILMPFFLRFLIRFWNCSDNVFFFKLSFGTVPTMWYLLNKILELFRQCGIFFY